jgi:hypothetical protein
MKCQHPPPAADCDLSRDHDARCLDQSDDEGADIRIFRRDIVGDKGSTATALPAIKVQGLAAGGVALRAVATGALAAGAAAVGALAIGAVAVGRLRIGDGAAKKLTVGRLEVDELVIGGRRISAEDIGRAPGSS